MTAAPKADDARRLMLEDWLGDIFDHPAGTIHPASADASFRRYFRFVDTQANRSLIVMDAPPDKEDCTAFIQISRLLRDAGVNAPEVITQDLSRGFLLLSDLGTEDYLNHLHDTPEPLYSDAIDALIKMQAIEADLPAYDDKKLTQEMALFEQWYVQRHLGATLSAEQQSILQDTMRLLCDNALEQPQVFVHRDYHSRNLMRTDENNPGVIDFQDAVIGPVTYDLVSLFKDCYIQWPRVQVEDWLDSYRQRSGCEHDREQFLRWFDLMGLQRHLKVLGIFARLNYRDGKSRYLDDLPLTLTYALDTCTRYPQLQAMHELLQQLTDKHA